MKNQLELIAIDDIYPNPHQPRLEFNEEELKELATSIQTNGLIQPIIVRKSPIFGYELIAGERRLRASKLAHLKTIPAIIKEISSEESMQQAIVENLQRSNLNPIEEAYAYQNLINTRIITHDQLAHIIGKSRPYITNCLRLLQLPQKLKTAVEKGELSQGHARVLLSLKTETEQLSWANKIIKQKLSVRDLERHLKPSSKKQKIDIFKKEQENELSKLFGAPVQLSLKNTGEITLKIQFKNEKDLNNVINRLN